MFAKKTKELIKEAIVGEYDNSKKQHDDRYRNMNEAWGVLAEEIFECKGAYKAMKWNGKTLFKNICKNEKRELRDNVRVCFANALNLAMEACQVAAVCQKILDGVEEC